MEDFIKNRFKCNVTTLAEIGIKVKRSAQVTLGSTIEEIEYCEITPKNIRPYGDYNYERNIKTQANPVSLKNQTLQAGDVLIPSRRKLSDIALFTDKKISEGSIYFGKPVVAANGMVIIRTENNDLAKFIEYYLYLPEVQSYINRNPKIRKSNGRVNITTDFIETLPFPSIIATENLSKFGQYKHKLHIIQQKLEKSAEILRANKNDTLANLYNDNTTLNVNKWEKFDVEFGQLKKKYPSLFLIK